MAAGTTISLGCLSPDTSSNHPGAANGRAALTHSRVLHQMGFTSALSLLRTWCALTAPFHLDPLPAVPDVYGSRPSRFCGTFLRLRRLPCCKYAGAGARLADQPLAGIFALWCPDFPHPLTPKRWRARPSVSQRRQCSTGRGTGAPNKKIGRTKEKWSGWQCFSGARVIWT